MIRPKNIASILAGLLLACLCSVALVSFSGCAFSDTITQKVYNQDDNSEVDQEMQPLLINTPDADQVSEELPQLKADDDAKDKQETKEELPRYGGDVSKALVAKQEYKDNSNDLDMSQPDKSERSDSTEAAGNSSTIESYEESKSEAGEGENTNEEEGDNPEGEGDNHAEEGSGKNANNEKKVYKDYGEFAEIPEDIKHVTAVGEAAVIVSMLGGTEKETPLVGADEDFVEDKNVQKVLASKSVDKVAKIWDNDGDSADDLKSIDKIVKADPELCFVMAGDKTLSDEQEDELVHKHNILVYELPNMTSASKITYAVQIVGDILEKGGNEQAGKIRDEYLEFHDSLVDKFKSKNGGITGDYNYDASKNISSKASALYTLLITDWDKSAQYNDENGYLSSSQGVGVSELGYEESPVAYYMSVGGVVNNASAGAWRGLSGRTAAVWQFTTSKASIAWKRWTSIDRDKVTYAPEVQGFDTDLLWNVDKEIGMGSSAFPSVVVSTQAQKNLMEKDASRDNGLYHPYSLISKGTYATYSSVGFYTGGNLVDACIGIEKPRTASVLNDGTKVDYYDVDVNPCGLFSNWIEGGVESVLESSWVYKTFRNDSYDVSSDVKEFYKSFYGYSLSDSELDTILNGPES